MAHTSPMALDRRVSPSPPPQPLSKRDKRRNNITDKLSDMIQTFTQDQHQHYRAQLQAIQVDMTMILRANPYENRPLDDSAEDVEQEIENVTGGSLPNTDAAVKDYLALAGKRYHEYVQQINHALEQRDADLTALQNRYDAAVAELEKSSSYKVQVAQREHLELATTVRSRLINSVTKKRDKLLREKEQLDIADNSALFFHPSQFTVNIPQSPGGIQSNRKTRHTRHRVGEAEEERQRKRKAPADEEATDSPAPSFRPLQNDTNGASSPFHDARTKTLYTQYEAPAFSIDRLFTEKELNHATVVAQLATHHFFHQPQTNHQNPENPPSLASVDGAADAVTGPPAITAEIDDIVSTQPNGSPPPTQAPEMERNISHHATRGATRANPLAALSEAAALTSTTTNPFVPVLIPITKTDKGAPTPPGVSAGEVDNDIALMLREDDAPTSNPEQDENLSNLQQIRERLLEQACQTTNGVAPFRLPTLETGPAAISGGVNRIPPYGFADPESLRFALRNGAGVGTAAAPPPAPIVNGNIAALTAAPVSVIGAAIPMSRTTSYAGSEAGAASEAGGVGMRRVRSRFV
ncbi:hypothetical protein D6D01_02283 [Aureobasidium pullulans]|uniref:Uncharacterized protein n=1 Tax=Aureobasidium pullulans TaxID=5580 RepID=A0A4S9LTP8_AURPU|nr:hypothetical protein D6D01_02283 [Aureobasidium pullulans]